VRTSIPAIGILMMSLMPAVLSAKGETVKITMEGQRLPTPIEITDSSVGTFSVWAGPGVHVNGIEQSEGFIIDWAKGPVAEPATGMPRLEVAFYAATREDGPVRKTYTVSYVLDASAVQGFVYLPGKGDEPFPLNAATMYHGHGLEGHWFCANGAWDAFARARIVPAQLKKPHR